MIINEMNGFNISIRAECSLGGQTDRDATLCEKQ